jgi:hypothetical protein
MFTIYGAGIAKHPEVYQNKMKLKYEQPYGISREVLSKRRARHA